MKRYGQRFADHDFDTLREIVAYQDTRTRARRAGEDEITDQLDDDSHEIALTAARR
jgi:hypothetical protein